MSFWRHLNPLALFAPVKMWLSASKTRRDCRGWAELVRDMGDGSAPSDALLDALKPEGSVTHGFASSESNNNSKLDAMRRRSEALEAKGRDLKKYRLWLELNANLDAAHAVGAQDDDEPKNTSGR